MYDQELFVSTLSGFTRTLLRPYDVDAVLQDLTERVTEVLSLAGSGVTLVKDERLTFATAFPGHLSALERAQEEVHATPCGHAYGSCEIVAVPDLRVHADTWPTYCAAAADARVGSAAGVPMYLADTVVGALNLYAAGPREWPAEDLAVAQVMADMATTYLINASQFRQHEQLNEQLQQALDSRVIVEQAKGLVGATRGTSMDHAFELIRGHARNHNTSLRTVAEAVVHLGLKL